MAVELVPGAVYTFNEVKETLKGFTDVRRGGIDSAQDVEKRRNKPISIDYLLPEDMSGLDALFCDGFNGEIYFHNFVKRGVAHSEVLVFRRERRLFEYLGTKPGS